jgi:ribosome-associated heat shock protein Hsp15
MIIKGNQSMDESIRLDKWLWSARFFKTRPLATEAVSGGKVHLNGSRVKPGKLVHMGDSLSIQQGVYAFEVSVLGINEKRRPASEARCLYEESEASITARNQLAEMQRLAAMGSQSAERKPSKHERGKIIRFKRKQA